MNGKKLLLALIILIMAATVVLTGCFPERITITFETNGGESLSSLKVPVSSESLDLPTPVRNGYVFDGWYYDSAFSSKVDIKVIPEEDCVFYAKWTPQLVTVTFKADDVAVAYKYVPYGSDLPVSEMPEVPAKAGFDGRWLTDGLTNVTAPVTVFAQYFLATYSVTYVVDGEEYAFYSGLPGDSILSPDKPEKDGSYFYGWYYDTAFSEPCLTLPTAIPDSNLMLYARFLDNSDMSRYLSYTVSDGEAKVTGLTSIGKNQTLIIIPETLGGYPVTAVGGASADPAAGKIFSSEVLSTLVIPSSVKHIGDYAFFDIPSLTEIKIEEGLLSVGKGAFAGLSSLTKISLPASTETVGDYAFAAVRPAEEGEDVLPVTDFGCDVTAAPSALTEIVFAAGSSLLGLGKNVLAYTAATSFTLPDSENYTFDYRSFALSSLTDILSANPSYVSVDGALYSADENRFVYLPLAKSGDFNVKEGTLSIDEGAFLGNKNISSVTLPDSLQHIGDRAFYSCTALKSVAFGAESALLTVGDEAFSLTGIKSFDLPDSVQSIGERVFAACSDLVSFAYSGLNLSAVPDETFRDCSALSSVAVTGATASVGDYAFYGCSALSELIFPAQSSLTEIGSYAFYDCASLRSFSLPSSLRTIGAYAFAGSEKIAAEPTIPSSVTYVGDYAFMNSGVRSFQASTGLTYIGKGAFKNCTVLNRLRLPQNSLDTVPEELFYGCTALTTLNIPSNFTSIEARAFYNCSAIRSVTFNKDALGNGILSIGESAFENCTSLLNGGGDESVLPSTLTSLGKRAFYNCSALPDVTIPTGLQKIAEEAFAYCSEISRISFTSGGITDTLGENSFAYCTSLVSVTLPSALALRSGTENVGAVKNPFLGCSSLAILDISGSSVLYSENGYIYFYGSDGLKTLYLYPAGKTGEFVLNTDYSAIDDYAFYGSGISSFSLSHNAPAGNVEVITLVKIGDYAFAESDLSSAVLSRRICSVGDYAFANSSLSALTVEETFIETDPSAFHIVNSSVSSNRLNFGEYAFAGTNLVSLSLPLRVETVGRGAFSDCYSLKTVAFADGANVSLQISDYAFASDSGLQSLFFPARTASIGDYAFAYCRNVGEIVFSDSDGALDIGDYAFLSNHYLTQITLPSSLASLGEGVFSDCSRLHSVYFAETLNASALALPAYAFYGSNALVDISLPGYISEVGEKAFYCTGLVSVEFTDNPDGSLSIGASAFEGVSGLVSVLLPVQLVSVGEKAFYKSGLTYIYYGQGSAFNVESYAFAETALEEIVLNERFRPVGEYVFADNSSLTAVTLESSDNTAFDAFFGDYMFKESALTTLSFPSAYSVTVSSIGKEAFADTVNLSSVSFEAADGIVIGEYAFRSSGISSFLLSGDPSSVVVNEGAFFHTLALESLSFVADALTAADYAFAESGISSLSLSATEFSAGQGIAYGSVNLASVDLIGSFTDFETVDGVLYGNTANGRVLLQYPAGKQGAVFELEDVSAVADYAFYGNGYLTTITVLAEEYIACGENSFGSTNSALTVFCASDKLSDYAAWGLPVKVLQTEFNGFVFTLLGNGRYEISGYTGTEESVTVKGTYSDGNKTFRVESVGDNAFLNNTAVKHITIDTGINSVGKYAFSGCTSLESVTFGNNVAVVKNHAFYGCVSLTSIAFNSNLDYIEDYAFANCLSLENVAFPDSLDSIGAYSFAYTALTDIDFGNGLSVIGDNAFENNTRLVEVRLPSSVSSIGDYVFRNCDNLTFLYLDSLTVPSLKSSAAFRLTPSGMRIFVPSYSVSNFKTATYWRDYSTQILSVDNISSLTGKENYVLTQISNGRYRLVAYIGEEKDVTIDPILEDTGIIVEIGEYAFSQFTETLTIGEGVTDIAANAFRNATSLVSVVLPESVRTIGTYAFAGLNKLSSVTFSENSALGEIGAYAFYDCVSLRSVTLPPNLSAIGKYAFSGSGEMNLETVTFLGYVTVVLSIDDYAFAGNGKVEEMVFNCAVSRFGEGAFADCVALKGIYLNSTGNVIAAIDETSTEVFANCDRLSVFLPSDATLRSYQQSWTSQYDRLRLVNSSYIAQDVIVDGIAIRQEGFVISPIGSGTVASIIGYIGDETEVVFPSTVIIGNNTYTITRIGRTENNSSTVLNGKVIGDDVTKVTIPNSVTEITGDAFRRTRLTEVVFAEGSTVSVIGRYAFAENPYLESVTIPKSVSGINEYAFAYNDALVSVNFEEPGLYDENSLTISRYAFAYCNALETMSFPKHLTTIGDHAFDGDVSLKNVTFRNDGSINLIGEYAFARTALVSIELPMSVSSVANYAFAECNDLVYVRLFRETGNGINSLTATYDNVFYGISNPFLRVYVPERSYTSYKDAKGWSSKNVIPDLAAGDFNYMFNASGANTVTLTAYNGTSENVVIPVNLTLNGTVYRITTIASYFGNASLESVSFASGSAVTTIEARAFAACSSLERIVLPDSVQNMGEYVFSDCSILTDVTLSANLNALPAYAFYNCSALKELTVPASVTTIGNASFLNCASLNRLTIGFSDATTLGLSALVGTHKSLIILVPEGRQNAFANQWLDYSSRIFDMTERYGDFILTANDTGYTLIQYNGQAPVLDLTTLTINGKQITLVSDGAIIHEETEIIR